MDFITKTHREKIEKRTKVLPNGCWLWTAYKDKNGYGIMNMKSKNRKVHRVVWVINNGDIPEGFFVCHKCDNPSCINPDHLFLGTPNDNVQDMMNKGRYKCGGKPHYGEKNGMSKLNEKDVLEIRGLRNKKTHKALSKQYNVSVSCIQNIMLRKSWKHI